MTHIDIERKDKRVALDWDGTMALLSPTFPRTEFISPHHVLLARYLQDRGFQVIISTARPDDYVQDIADTLNLLGYEIPVTNSKPDVDILIDDRAGAIDLDTALKHISGTYPKITMEDMEQWLKDTGAETLRNAEDRPVIWEPQENGDVLVSTPFHEQSLQYRVPVEYSSDVRQLVPKITQPSWVNGRFLINVQDGTTTTTLNNLLHTPKDIRHDPIKLVTLNKGKVIGTSSKEPLPPSPFREGDKPTDINFVVYHR